MASQSKRKVTLAKESGKKGGQSGNSRQTSPSLKFVALDEHLYRYVVAHRSRSCDPVLDELRAETEKLGSLSEMLISREQGSFLTLLVASLGARSAVEIGTFTGYSAICISRGLSPQGRLLCIDVNGDWTAIAQRHWRRAGIEGKSSYVLWADGQTRGVAGEARVRFCLHRRGQPSYDLYYELVLPVWSHRSYWRRHRAPTCAGNFIRRTNPHGPEA